MRVRLLAAPLFLCVTLFPIGARAASQSKERQYTDTIRSLPFSLRPAAAELLAAPEPTPNLIMSLQVLPIETRELDLEATTIRAKGADPYETAERLSILDLGLSPILNPQARAALSRKASTASQLLSESDKRRLTEMMAYTASVLSDLRQLQLQTQEPARIHHARGDSNADQYLPPIIDGAPAVARTMGIRRKSGAFERYSAEKVNSSFDGLVGTPREVFFRFKNSPETAVNSEFYARLWADGFLPHSLHSLYWGTHDIGDHGAAAALWAREIIYASRGLMSLWLECIDDPMIRLNAGLLAFSRRQIHKISDDVDRSSGDLMHYYGDLARRPRPIFEKALAHFLLIHEDFRAPAGNSAQSIGQKFLKEVRSGTHAPASNRTLAALEKIVNSASTAWLGPSMLPNLIEQAILRAGRGPRTAR